MLIKGNPRGGPAELARHLKKEHNEEVEVIGAWGLAAQDVDGALMEMDALGAMLRTQRTLYHASISPEPGKDRLMTEAEWDYARKAFLSALDLQNQPHFVVQHLKRGDDGELRLHRHVIVARTDLEHGRAIRCDHNYRKHEEVARHLERVFGHRHTQGAHVGRDGKERPPRTATAAEQRETDRGGISAKDAKAFVTGLWKATDSAKALQAALENHGWKIARGDKVTSDGRPYLMLVDPHGGTHELRRRVDGVKAAVVHARMAEIDADSLPTLADAKRAQLHAQEAAKRQVDDIRPTGPGNQNTRTGGPENERQAPSDPTFAGRDLEHRSGPETDELERRKHRKPEREDMDEDPFAKQRQQRQEIEDREAGRYNDMVADRNRADHFIQEWDIHHQQGEQNKRHLQEAQWRREAEGDITDVRARALIAAGESRDFVQAVRREGAMITQEHSELQRSIALEKDPEQKQLLELKRDIQHADYMALANERIGAMSNLNSDQYKEAQRQQEGWSQIGTDLRKERLELQERISDREMDTINAAVQKLDTADQQRAEFRAEVRGQTTDVPYPDRPSHHATQRNGPKRETTDAQSEVTDRKQSTMTPEQQEQSESVQRQYRAAVEGRSQTQEQDGGRTRSGGRSL